MTDDADGDEGRGKESGLLPELAPGGILRGFVALETAAGQFPEPPEEPLRRPTAHQPTVAGGERNDRGEDVGPVRPRTAGGQSARVRKFLAGSAIGGDRARRAVGAAGPADRLAELHQRLVELPGPLPRELPLQGLPQAGPNGGSANVVLLERPPGGHAEAVRLEGHDRFAEGEARHGGAHVRAEAGEFRELPRGRREESVPLPHNLAGGLPEVAGASVVAQALPRLQHLPFRTGCERLNGRERLQERGVAGGRGRHAGLLEEDLRDPDPVRVAVGSPRERPSVCREPGEEPVRPGRRRRAPSGGRTIHVVPNETKH